MLILSAQGPQKAFKQCGQTRRESIPESGVDIDELPSGERWLTPNVAGVGCSFTPCSGIGILPRGIGGCHGV